MKKIFFYLIICNFINLSLENIYGQNDFLNVLKEKGAKVYDGGEHIVIYKEANWKDEDFKEFNKISKLTILVIEGDNITDSVIEYISNNKNIEALDITSKNITGMGFKNIGRDSKIDKLSLNNTSVSDEGLKYISELKNLEDLEINNTKITDEGLKYLKKLPNLKNLYLSGTQITDKGIRYLSDVKSLHYIAVIGCKKVTRKALENLKKSLSPYFDYDYKLPPDAHLR